MDASPTKRRALATLDVNANSPNKHARLNAAKASGQLNVYKGGSPSPSPKRALIAEEGDENSNPLQPAGAPPAKRACLSAATSAAPSTAPSSPTPRRVAASPAVTPATTTTKAVAGTSTTTTTTSPSRAEDTEEEDVAPAATPEKERQNSHTPETSAVFDNSQLDNSQLTTITEPDHPSPQQQEQQQQLQQQPTQEESPAATASAPAPSSLQLSPSAQQQQPPPPQQRSRALSSLTREQARQKAEILRLRLGLARYKVRTGQTDVPLERLQRRPVLPAHSSSTTITTATTHTTTQSSPAAPQSHSQPQPRRQQQPSASFSSPTSAATTRQPLPAPRRLSREDGSSGSERQQTTTPRKALPSGRSASQTPRQGRDCTPPASQESAASQPSRPRGGVATPDREALQRLAASAALDASRRIEEAADGGRRGSSG